LILLKTVSREYFRQNIGFYLFILLFAFGFLTGREHVAFAKLFMSNGNLLLWAALFWLMHVLKTTLFFHRTLKLTEYAFLQDFTLFTKPKKILDLLVLQINLNAPFLAYSLFMVLIGFQNGHILGILFVIAVNVILITIPLLFHYYQFHHFNLDFKIHFLGNQTSLMPNWPSQYFIRHLFINQPILYFSTIAFALFFIIGGAKLYYTDDYDERLLFICCLLAVSGQFQIGKEFGSFSAHNLLFEKNMPLKSIHRTVQNLASAFGLVAIEIVFLVYYWVNIISIFHIFSALLFIIGGMFFWLNYNYAPSAFQDTHLKRIYFGAISVFLLIMFKIPMLFFAIAISAISWWILKSNYFTFEFTSNDSI